MQEFRERAVKGGLEDRLTVPEAARRVSRPAKILANWIPKARSGKLSEVGDLTRRAAYWAKASGPGTRS